MAKNHTTQHKTTEKGKSKELAELRKENHTLKRKVAKLQKYLQKTLESVNQETSETEADDTPLATEPAGCPDCKNLNLVVITLPSGKIKGCKACGWKKKE